MDVTGIGDLGIRGVPMRDDKKQLAPASDLSKAVRLEIEKINDAEH